MNWPLLQNSLLISATATLLALALGLGVALWLAILPARWQRVVLVLTIVALALPPFLVVNCWLNYLGQTGAWRRWLPVNLFSLGGTVWLLALLLWPVSALAVFGAWRRIPPTLLESDSALRGGLLLRWLLLPLARGALATAAALTFVLALNNFAVPAILQTRVFPAELWVSFNTTFDYAAALHLCWPLVCGPLLLVWLLRHRAVAWPATANGADNTALRRQLGARWRIAVTILGVATLALSVGLPLADLLASSRIWAALPGALAAGQSALWQSFVFAAVTATLTVLFGLATWRWRLGAWLWLPFLVPGVLLGIGWIWLLNRPPFIAFYQSVGVVLLALTVRYLAIGWNGVAHARRAVDRDLADLARLDGASRWETWRHVVWPQCGPQLAAAWYVVYLLCLWDVESLVVIVPPGTETVALRIFNLLHYGHNAQVDALCFLLLALALLPLGMFWLARAKQFRFLKPTLAFALLAVAANGCRPANEGEAPVQSKFFSRVKIIGSRGAGAGQFNKPRSVAVDARDNLFVADMTGRVQKFSPDGAFLASFQMEQTDKGRPKGMCRDAAGNIVVVEPHYARVNHFSPDLKIIRHWGEHGTNAGQLSFPRAAAVNTRGEIYVSEYMTVERVQRFSANGERFLGAFGKPGRSEGEFDRAEGIGVDAQGRVYVADSCNHRVQVFTGEGKFLGALGKAGAGRGEMSYPYDVQVDAAGNIFVCEFGNSRIQVFNASREPLEILGGPGGAAGQFSNPWGIALDSKGNLYVADSVNHRVQKFLRRASGGEG
ncbi:MAG: hypothetical protein HZA89_03330 [Verrucomicrobia bacterium]|nr:hypothetical protein [Verrucomicrobiota bacterium]